MRKIVFAALLLLLFFLLVGDRFFISKLRFISFLNRLSPSEESQRITELEKENNDLKFQLLNQKIKKADTVKVYSGHPFSNRGEIAIAAGRTNGIQVGDIITHGDSILVGRITKVFDSMSIVTTIFNPSWKSAVRIGEGEVDALLQGGNEPTITLIPLEDEIHDGELVITASQDLPYGLGIGTIKNIRTASGNAFKEASIEPGFQLKELKDANIYR